MENIERDSACSKNTVQVRNLTKKILILSILVIEKHKWMSMSGQFRYRQLSLFLYLFVMGSVINGSSGLGSSMSEHIDNNTFDIFSAGLHLSFRISRQIPLNHQY